MSDTPKAADQEASSVESPSSPQKDTTESRPESEKGPSGKWIIGAVLIIIVGSIAIAAALVGKEYMADTKIKIEEFKVTNVTSSSASIVWTTDKATMGAVIVSENDDLGSGLLAANGRLVYYDDRDVVEVDQNVYEVDYDNVAERYTHHATIKDLEPEVTYYFKIKNGYATTEGELTSFTTVEVAEDMVEPDPVYGKVRDTEGTEVADGIVMLRRSNETEKSEYTSAPVRDGRYSIDAANLMKEDGTGMFEVSESDTEEILVWAAIGESVETTTAYVPADRDQPAAPIELEKSNESSESSRLVSQVSAQTNNCCNTEGYGDCEGGDNDAWVKGYEACQQHKCPACPEGRDTTKSGKGGPCSKPGDCKDGLTCGNDGKCVDAEPYEEAEGGCPIACEDGCTIKKNEISTCLSRSEEDIPMELEDPFGPNAWETAGCDEIGYADIDWGNKKAEAEEKGKCIIAMCQGNNQYTLTLIDCAKQTQCDNPKWTEDTTTTKPDCNGDLMRYSMYVRLEKSKRESYSCTEMKISYNGHDDWLCCKKKAEEETPTTEEETPTTPEQRTCPDNTTEFSPSSSEADRSAYNCYITENGYYCCTPKSIKPPINGRRERPSCIQDCREGVDGVNTSKDGIDQFQPGACIPHCNGDGYCCDPSRRLTPTEIGVQPGQQGKLLKNQDSFWSNLFGTVKAQAEDETYEAGIYSVTGQNVTTSTVTINESGAVEYFWDEDGDGIKDETEEYIEGDPPEVTLEKVADTMDYSLGTGWNLLSIPMVMQGDETSNVTKASELLAELNEQGALVTHIVSYQGGVFQIYSERMDTDGEMQVFGEDFNLILGRGYFVKNYQETVATLDGRKVDGAMEILMTPGWNLVGIYNKDKSDYTGFEVLGQMQNADVPADVLSKWEDSKYHNLVLEDSEEYGIDYNIYEDTGYWVRMGGETELKFTPE